MEGAGGEEDDGLDDAVIEVSEDTTEDGENSDLQGSLASMRSSGE